MTSRPSVRYDPSPRELREKLLDFTGEFVANARLLVGVERVALLGSILTPKENPKNVDVRS